MNQYIAKKIFDRCFIPNGLKYFKNLEKELDGLVIEVILKDTSSTSNVTQTSLRLALKDEVKEADKFQQDIPQTNSEIEKMFDRIDLLQRKHTTLLDKIDAKILELKEQYKNKDFEIIILQHNIHFDMASESLDTRQTPAPKGSPNKRKLDLHSESSGKRQCLQDYPKLDGSLYTIGPNGTQVNQKDYESISWKDAGLAARQLCSIIFGDRVLAVHSLTGKQSPAFRGRERPSKAQLNPKKTDDIIYFVCMKFGVQKQLVRTAIASKCGDAARRCSRKIRFF